MKAGFFIHCYGEKRKDHIIFCSSAPLARNGNAYDYNMKLNFNSCMFNRSKNEEMYDFILEKLERIHPMDRTLVWEADL